MKTKLNQIKVIFYARAINKFYENKAIIKPIKNIIDKANHNVT